MITNLISKIEKKLKYSKNNFNSSVSNIFNLSEYQEHSDFDQDPNQTNNMQLFNKLASKFLSEDKNYEIICQIFQKLVSKWPQMVN